MCLAIDKRVKAKRPNKDGYCVGWKVISTDDVSPFQHYKYCVGVNVANIDSWTKHREGRNDVYGGFHLFATRDDARFDLKDWDTRLNQDTYKIVQVFYKPEHVIAYGTYTICNRICSSVAVTELLVKSLKHAR